jgi:phage tail sheath gpL-like
MGVDASAVARVLGITTEFKDLRSGNVLYLPQRCAVIGQGCTASTYATTKRQFTKAGDAAAVYGFGSPIHLALRELLPTNGDGVGTVPVTVYPMADAGGSAAALGDITPSGTPTKATSYRVLVNKIKSPKFVIGAGALATAANLTAAVAAMGEAISSVLEMPITVTYDYGTVTASALTGTGNGTLTALSVTGSPVPGVYRLKLKTTVANGGVWTLYGPAKGTSIGDIVADNLTQTVGASTATVLTGGGLQFTVTDGSADFSGANTYFDITVPGTSVNTISKWKGESANGITIEIEADESVGVTFAITQPTGGLVNPTVDASLAQIGGVWESQILNCLNISDTTALDTIMTFGEGLWGTTKHQPLMAWTGVTAANVDTATDVSEDRRTDRVNGQLVAPGSKNLPFVVAARQLARILKVANNTPSRNYTAQKATGITPGTDAEQWDDVVRDQAVKLGSSTIEVVDGVVQLSDIMMFYRPTGEEPPAYRYACNIVKLQNIIFNLRLIFASEEWAGAALVPDDEVITEPTARKPKTAKAQVAGLLDELGKAALIVNVKAAKKTITAVIDSQNPMRLNVGVTVQLSGNSQIIDVNLAFGFYFGEAALAA